MNPSPDTSRGQHAVSASRLRGGEVTALSSQRRAKIKILGMLYYGGYQDKGGGVAMGLAKPMIQETRGAMKVLGPEHK